LIINQTHKGMMGEFCPRGGSISLTLDRIFVEIIHFVHETNADVVLRLVAGTTPSLHYLKEPDW
jgi:hypothetical protein